MVLRQGKRRVFLACRRHVRPVADTRRHAANHGPTHYGDYPCRLFRRRTGFQTTRLDVLVSRRRQRADACRFRRQPVCQTNRHRTPRPTATPRSAARRRAPHPPRYANLVRLLHPQRRNRRHSGRLAILRLVGGLHRHRVVCVDGAFVCWRVGVSESRIEGVGRLKCIDRSARHNNLFRKPDTVLRKIRFLNRSIQKKFDITWSCRFRFSNHNKYVVKIWLNIFSINFF